MSNAELRAVRASSATGTRIAGANPLVAAVSRLVPFSGIQFVDIAIRTASLSATAGKFIEEPDPEVGPLLVPLNERADCDGVEWHPLTGERLAPYQSHWISGYQALEPFLEQWIPLPYLRFIGRGEDGEPRYDKGPSNWVRLFVERPPQGLRNVDTLKAVVAIDTQVDSQSRNDQIDYLLPNNDDVVFAPIFKLVSDAAHIDEFLGSDWFDAWLSRLYKKFEDAGSAQASVASNAAKPETAFTLERVARYLSMLKVLDGALEMPQLQFVDIRSAHWRTRLSSVDLLLDIDSTETSAAIVPSRDEAPANPEQVTESLKFRDLTCPTQTHEGPFPTVAEFSLPDFGDEHASLRSGRLDAFYWPSLVRVGAEGLRLSHAPGAVPGQTGIASLIDSIADTKAHSDIWRFSRSRTNDQSEQPGAMVAGRLLSHVAEDGKIITGDAAELEPALRPHFSLSAVLSMFIAECFLHAMTQISEPDSISRSGHLRTLKRILITCPPSSTNDEREQLKVRVEQALDQIWSALGWNKEGALTPHRPEVALSIDTALSSQIVYLHEEIQQRFSGGIRQFVSLVGRSGFERRNGMPAGLRVAALDLASRATTLCVVNYTVGSEGSLTPSIEVADRTAVAGDSLTEAIINAHILPSIASALDAAGHSDGAALLVRALESSQQEQEKPSRHFSAGFMRKVLIPAATALIDLNEAAPGKRQTAIVRRVTLGHLVRAGDGRMAPLDAKFEALAAADGVREFCLSEVLIALDANELSQTISQHFAETLARASDACRALRADLVLLSGRYADLSEVYELVEMSLPLSPHRIINMNERIDGAAFSGRSTRMRSTVDPRLAMLVGAATCGRRSEAQFDRFSALVEDLRLADPPKRVAAWLTGEGSGGTSARRVGQDEYGKAGRAIAHEAVKPTPQNPRAEGAA